MRNLRVVLGLAVGATTALAACASGSPSVVVHSLAAAPMIHHERDTASKSSHGATQWLSYHADSSRTAAVAADPALDNAKRVWTRNLGAVVHNQPVVADGRVFVATEGDRVVALNPKNGHIIWSRSVGKPLTDVDQRAGCGDIDPLGITSTPVADPKTGRLYVVAEVATATSASHQLDVLSMKTGKLLKRTNVDPPLPSGERAINLLQRASLAMANGRIYIPYGGNDGDCGSYHGWVVGVNATGKPDKISFEVANNGQGGAIWEAGGAPAVAGNGDLYVTTGNANPDPPQGGPDPKHYTESVVRLSPTLKPLASFKDKVAGGDEDLATGNPVLLPDKRVFAVGKTDIGYVLTQSNLHQVAAIHGVCGSDPDGGPAFDRSLDKIFVPCKDGGIQVVNLKTDTLGKKLSGANSAPILVGQRLWATDYNGGTLYEYDAANGNLVHTVSSGAEVPNFATPVEADGRILLGTETGVVAFR